VIDSSEADALTALQFCNQLRREDKEALERYFYCRAWGISNHALDAAFFEHHSAADSSAAPLRVLQAALTCGRTMDTTALSLADDGGEMALPVQARAKVIAELLQALGVTNVLDKNTPPIITLTAEKLDALRTCQAFNTAERSRSTVRVFGIDSGMWACGEVADYLEQLQLSGPYSRYAALTAYDDTWAFQANAAYCRP